MSILPSPKALLLFAAKWTQVDYVVRAKQRNIPQFICIPYSHYVEFARWCLEASNIKVEEHGFAPGQHFLPVINVRIGQTKRYLSDSSFVQKVNRVGDARVPTASQAAQARSTAVPLLVLPNGVVLRDSWAIAAYSGLKPPSDDIRKILDEELGPLVRQWTYCLVLKKQYYETWTRVCTEDTSLLWKLLWFTYVGSRLTNSMQRMFRINDRAAIQECRARLHLVLEHKLAGELKNKKGKYLSNEDAPGVADYALAALAGTLVNAPQYCQGRFKALFDKLEREDEDARNDIAIWRKTEVGKHALMMYEVHRKIDS